MMPEDTSAVILCAARVNRRFTQGGVGGHAYSGACAPEPTEGGDWLNERAFLQETFSLGIFRWEPRQRGGRKRSKARVRVYGPATPEGALAVYEEAERLARKLDAGEKVQNVVRVGGRTA